MNECFRSFCAVLLGGCFLASGCTQEKSKVVAIKTLIWAADSLAQESLRIQGKLERIRAGGVFADLEDGTGAITVSTEQIPRKQLCPLGATLDLGGKLVMLGENRLVFRVEKVFSCQ